MILDLQTHSDASEDSRVPVAPPAQIVTNLQTMAWLVCLPGLTANDKYVDPALRLL
ncbi:MAG: hypothetical protein ABSA52_01115 [Candidatus Binatia bacterium]|jgi:hypothetical protein